MTTTAKNKVMNDRFASPDAPSAMVACLPGAWARHYRSEALCSGSMRVGEAVVYPKHRWGSGGSIVAAWDRHRHCFRRLIVVTVLLQGRANDVGTPCVGPVNGP